MDSQAKTTIISLHGIRTRGKWQRDLEAAIERGGFSYRSLDFGFFRAISLLNPWARSQKVDWFLQEYTRIREQAPGPISVIAHSFGSYIVTKALERYSGIEIDRLILCGSIVRRGYDWDSIILKREQVKEVLNQFGGRDIWVRLAEWGISDAGPSGFVGFTKTAGGRVYQQSFKHFSHSQYFYDINYKKNWIPFLKGNGAAPEHGLQTEGVNYKFAATIVLCISMMAGAVTWFHKKSEVQDIFNSIEILFSRFFSHEPEDQHPDISIENRKGTPLITDSSNTPNAPTEDTSSVAPLRLISLTTDYPCIASVDGAPSGEVQKNTALEIDVADGEREFKCADSQNSGASVTHIVNVTKNVNIHFMMDTEVRKTRLHAAWERLQGEWGVLNSRPVASSDPRCSLSEDREVRLEFRSPPADGRIDGVGKEYISRTTKPIVAADSEALYCFEANGSILGAPSVDFEYNSVATVTYETTGSGFLQISTEMIGCEIDNRKCSSFNNQPITSELIFVNSNTVRIGNLTLRKTKLFERIARAQ